MDFGQVDSMTVAVVHIAGCTVVVVLVDLSDDDDDDFAEDSFLRLDQDKA